jgi:AcrR family transcriptional regulator
MRSRLSRVEQSERNRSLVLGAARDVFMARGYHAATLEQIAESAGFSRGVVYSQFESKADLFLSLLEARIEVRAARHGKLVARLGRSGGVRALVKHLAGEDRADRRWLLLVAEFRVHAARDPELNSRYAAAHARTVEALAQSLATAAERSGEELPLAPRELAEVALALANGSMLEQAANPGALGGRRVGELIAGLLVGAEKSFERAELTPVKGTGAQAGAKP